MQLLSLGSNLKIPYHAQRPLAAFAIPAVRMRISESHLIGSRLPYEFINLRNEYFDVVSLGHVTPFKPRDCLLSLVSPIVNSCVTGRQVLFCRWTKLLTNLEASESILLCDKPARCVGGLRKVTSHASENEIGRMWNRARR